MIDPPRLLKLKDDRKWSPAKCLAPPDQLRNPISIQESHILNSPHIPTQPRPVRRHHSTLYHPSFLSFQNILVVGLHRSDICLTKNVRSSSTCSFSSASSKKSNHMFALYRAVSRHHHTHYQICGHSSDILHTTGESYNSYGGNTKSIVSRQLHHYLPTR